MFKFLFMLWALELGAFAIRTKQERRKRQVLQGVDYWRRETLVARKGRLILESYSRYSWLFGMAVLTFFVVKFDTMAGLVFGNLAWVLTDVAARYSFNRYHELGEDMQRVLRVETVAVPAPHQPNDEHGGGKIIRPESVQGMTDREALR